MKDQKNDQLKKEKIKAIIATCLSAFFITTIPGWFIGYYVVLYVIAPLSAYINFPVSSSPEGDMFIAMLIIFGPMFFFAFLTWLIGVIYTVKKWKKFIALKNG